MTRRRKAVLAGVVVLGAAVLGLATWLWWQWEQAGPQAVFWQTVRQGLTAQGAAIEATETQNGATAHQATAFFLGKTPTAHALVALQRGKNTVKTETISTANTDYTRYTAMPDPHSTTGQPLANPNVIGVWSRSDSTQAGSAHLLGQAVLGAGLPLGSVPVPIGDVNDAARNSLVSRMQSGGVYQPDFAHVQKAHQAGQLYYTYTVDIQPMPYAAVMKDFAKALGLHDLDSVNPGNYQHTGKVRVKLTIDARAHRLSQVYYQPSRATWRYTSYNVPLQVAVPAHAISAGELQQRLAAL